jgi:cell division protein FtsB
MIQNKMRQEYELVIQEMKGEKDRMAELEAEKRALDAEINALKRALDASEPGATREASHSMKQRSSNP